ncbi:MAG TPA: retroviral-like aspartic protease family protein [Steroidobacteraceae bacterium]|jgi:predicted aspartyl protease|nr:retroviral-like aspartic protease family protein [Steroidobacteraceae bacterium]
MKTFILVACVAALLRGSAWAAPHPASAAKPDPSDMLFAAPTQLDRSGRIVVPVFIDGKGPFRFLVDTGADGSMISQSLVSRLGLTSNDTSDERVQGTTGIEQLPCVTIADLRIGSIVKHNVPMPVSPSPVMTGLGGILGMAGFGPVRVVVNFRSNRVEIDRSSDRLVQGYLGIQARRTSGGLLMIPVIVGDVPVEAVIDTGAEVTLGNTALRQALLRQAAKHPEDARIYGVTRQVSDGGLAITPWITVGPVVVQGLGIVYSDIPIFRIWHLDSQPALIIGMNVLGSVDALVLDYPRARIYLRPAQTGVSVDIDAQMSLIKHGLNDDADGG